MTSMDTDSRFVPSVDDEIALQTHHGRLCEPLRSIDQLYLQGKSMAPFLSAIMQKWAGNANCMFMLKQLEESGGTNIVNMDMLTQCVPRKRTLSLGAILSTGVGFFHNLLWARSVKEEHRTKIHSWEKWTDLQVTHTWPQIHKIICGQNSVRTIHTY